MQSFLSILGFFFLLFIASIAVIVWKVRKRMKTIRDAMQDSMNDEAFRRMADKNYYRHKRNERADFDEDYFKGDPDRDRKQQESRQQQQQTRTTFTTGNGVTIIDDRDPSSRKKIFAQDEGEYVDFKEE